MKTKKILENNFSFLVNYLLPLPNEIFFGFNLANRPPFGLSSSKNSGGATGPIIGAAPTPTVSREILLPLVRPNAEPI